MKFKQYLFGIFSITLLALGFWLLILFNFNPKNEDILVIAAFFGSLYLWLSGFLSLLLFYIKIQFANREIVFGHFVSSVRQASLISILIGGLLVFQTLHVLTWWDVVLLTIIIILIELFFRTRKTIK